MLPENRAVLDRVNPVFYFAAVTLIFFTFLPMGWSIVVLWTLGIGVLISYVLFRNRSGAPNVLIHLQTAEKAVREEAKWQECCAVCGDKSCTRHQKSPKVELLLPWESLMVPKVVDDSVTEFIEIVLERFVDPWHNDLTGSKLFPNELRMSVRYALCLFLLRVRKIDIPALVMSQLVQAAASHMDSYITIRKAMQPGSTREELEEQVLLRLGSNLHPAMKGPTAALDYFKGLVRAALPFLLPPGTSESKLLKVFLEELLASKIMAPCMDYVASADFINKFLIRVFDRNSVLVPMIGPQSRSVPLLQRFVRQSSRNPLQLDMDQITGNEEKKYLFWFIDHLKHRGCVHLLQFYLDCEELWTKVVRSHDNGRYYSSSQSHIKELEKLYDEYISPSANTKICFHPRSELETAFEELLSSDVSHAAKINKLIEKKLLERASYHVKVVMQENFCPSFYHSQEFQHILQPSLTAMHRKTMATADEHSLSKHFERWRLHRKRSSTQSSPSSTSISSDATVEFKPCSQVSYSRHRSVSSSSVSLSPGLDEGLATQSQLEESGVFCAVLKVQIIDWNQERRVDVMKKPFIIYTLNTRYEKDGVKKYVQVRRRYKEFAVMDARLRQFYGDAVSAVLPPKKAFHNMDKAFIESRVKHLETYLNDLLQIPVLNTSRLLLSFLMETSDPQLFMPDSKAGRAGKIIKLVPNILKKEPKGQYLDPFLSLLVDKVALPPRQPCPERMEQAQRQEELIQQMKEQLQDNSCPAQRLGKACPDTTYQTGEPLQISGVFDLLVYMAMHVYHSSRPQMIALMGTKLIAQNSVETLLRSIVATKVNLLCSEARLTELIDMVKHELFFDDSPPRTDKDKEIRRQTALELILACPPNFVIALIGQERFHCNTTLLVEGLQSHTLNKQMLFTMLDMVVMEIFPEFRSKTTPTNA